MHIPTNTWRTIISAQHRILMPGWPPTRALVLRLKFRKLVRDELIPAAASSTIVKEIIRTPQHYCLVSDDVHVTIDKAQDAKYAYATNTYARCAT